MFEESEENQVVAADEESIMRTTEWYNPTDDTVTLDLHVATPSNTRKVPLGSGLKPLTFRERTGKVRYVIGPKKTALIPSEFDNAIQVVRDGFIQSGLGPQLVNKGSKEQPKMHHALDVERAAKKAALTEAQIAYQAKAESDVRLAAAMDKMRELEKLIEVTKAQVGPSPGPTNAAPNAPSAIEGSDSPGRQFVQPPKKKD